MLEREVKLRAAPAFQLPDLNGVAQGLSATRLRDEQLETVYYDTPDLRLARWSCSLRFRGGHGWTLKLPAASTDQTLARRELVFEGDSHQPPDAAKAIVLAYVRRAPLVPIATLSAVRKIIQLKDAAGSLKAEVVDDDVSVIQGLRVADHFREVEVELRDSGDDVLGPVLSRLKAAGADDQDPTPKYLRALGARGARPPEINMGELQPDATAGDLVRNAIATSAVILFRHDPGVRLGDDPEDVHRARVATRRLRSQLRTFGTLLRSDWSDPLREELRWLGGELGAVRDRQVTADRLRHKSSEMPAEDASLVKELGAQLWAESEETRSKLILTMRSDRYLDLLESLIQASRVPTLLPEASQPAVDLIRPLARRDWKKLRSTVKALPDDPADAELHRVRILAKRVRYAAEAAQPVGGKKSVAFAKAAADLQTVLGDHQDCVNLQGWLRQAGKGKFAFVAGELTALERAAAASLRREWREIWKLLDRKSLRKWMI
jgi:CHAD domain-containing protein